MWLSNRNKPVSVTSHTVNLAISVKNRYIIIKNEQESSMNFLTYCHSFH